jgi:hypothetical protein
MRRFIEAAFALILAGTCTVTCATTRDNPGVSQYDVFPCKGDNDCDGGRCESGICTNARHTAEAGVDASLDRATPPVDAPRAPRDAGRPPLDSGTPSPDQGATCVLSNTSTIPHVHLEIPDFPCTFTLKHASQGLVFEYDVVIDEDVPGYTTRYNDLGVIDYPEPTVGGLHVAVAIGGGGQSYCVCDRGLPIPFCTLDDGGFSGNFGSNPCRPITLRHGRYHQAYAWDGRNWNGPSDTGNSEGAPFPPGDYTLKIRIPGQITDEAGTRDVAASADVLVRLVP